MDLESVATPMQFKPLSTYMVLPVIAEANGEHKNAAVCPTSMASNGFSLNGAFVME